MGVINRLKTIQQQQLRNIPVCNHSLYRAVWCDYRLRFAAEPDQYDELAAQLWSRIQALRNPAMQHMPPNLYRPETETATDHLTRCYKSGGYHIASH